MDGGIPLLTDYSVRPCLQLRVEQVLQGQLTPVLAYKLMNLLDFYSGTVSVHFCCLSLPLGWSSSVTALDYPRCYASL